MPSHGSPVPLQKFQIALRLRLQISSGPKKKDSNITVSQSPRKMNLFQDPQRGPSGKSCPFPEPSFTYLSDSLINKVSWPNNISPFSQSPGKGASPPWCPTGSLWRKTVLSTCQAELEACFPVARIYMSVCIFFFGGVGWGGGGGAVRGITCYLSIDSLYRKYLGYKFKVCIVTACAVVLLKQFFVSDIWVCSLWSSVPNFTVSLSNQGER
jgi:hypothetical protein